MSARVRVTIFAAGGDFFFLSNLSGVVTALAEENVGREHVRA